MSIAGGVPTKARALCPVLFIYKMKLLSEACDLDKPVSVIEEDPEGDSRASAR